MLLKKALAIATLLFVLSGCQQASQNSNAANSSSSAEKAVSESTTKDSTSSLVSSTNTTQSKEEQSMTNVPGSLIQSVSENDIAKVTEILKSTPNLIDEVNGNGETPLLIAVHNNQIDIAKLLIDAGADVNKQDAKKDSAYLYAGAEGRTEILSYILSHSQPNQQITNRFGGNALIPAAEKGHLENVKLLLADKNVDINHQNNYGYTALIEAVALRDGSQVYQDIVSELLKHGADPDIKDNYGKSAKDYAHELGYGNMSKMLQESKR